MIHNRVRFAIECYLDTHFSDHDFPDIDPDELAGEIVERLFGDDDVMMIVNPKVKLRGATTIDGAHSVRLKR